MDDLIQLAKEKGFLLNPKSLTCFDSMHQVDESFLWMCELQKWLRDEYNIILTLLLYKILDDDFNYVAEKYIWMVANIKSSTADKEYFGNYDEALESGLNYALRLIK